jgi:hypothetical protein
LNVRINAYNKEALMNEAKCIGLDVRQATISVAVRDAAGKLVMEAILETKAETILQFLRGLRGSLHVTFEEGTWAAGCHTLVIFSKVRGTTWMRNPLRRFYLRLDPKPAPSSLRKHHHIPIQLFNLLVNTSML